ncbi:unnamed protein product [Closterium sp. NIES-64]|nr:unnamed protein product [Closterium sp. NIES-64]
MKGHCEANAEGSGSGALGAANRSPLVPAMAATAEPLSPVLARTRRSTATPVFLTCLSALVIISLAVAGWVAPLGTLSALVWGRGGRIGEPVVEEENGDRVERKGKGEGKVEGKGEREGEEEPMERECSMTYMWPDYIRIPMCNRTLEEYGLDSKFVLIPRGPRLGRQQQFRGVKEGPLWESVCALHPRERGLLQAGDVM